VSDRHTAEHYLKRAEELRAVAAELTSKESRDSLIRAAEEFERMAERLLKDLSDNGS
jgi:hypothetical protein